MSEFRRKKWHWRLATAALVTVVTATAFFWRGPAPVQAVPQAVTSGVSTATTVASAPECNASSLGRWQLLSTPDTTAGRAVLFAEGRGSHRVAPGDVLSGDAVVQSVGSTQVTLACLGSSTKRTINAPAPPQEVARVAAPLGN